MEFREDLFYRLNVFPLLIPPLRERADDIPFLVSFLVDKYMMRIGKRVEGISAKSLHRLRSYRWPGNVRELENMIERAIILADGPVIEIDPEMLPGSTEPATGPASPTTGASLEEIERQHIVAVLKQTNWVIEGPNGAAKILDLCPSTIPNEEVGRHARPPPAIVGATRSGGRAPGPMASPAGNRSDKDL